MADGDGGARSDARTEGRRPPGGGRGSPHAVAAHRAPVGGPPPAQAGHRWCWRGGGDRAGPGRHPDAAARRRPRPGRRGSATPPPTCRRHRPGAHHARLASPGGPSPDRGPALGGSAQVSRSWPGDGPDPGDRARGRGRGAGHRAARRARRRRRWARVAIEQGPWAHRRGDAEGGRARRRRWCSPASRGASPRGAAGWTAMPATPDGRRAAVRACPARGVGVTDLDASWWPAASCASESTDDLDDKITAVETVLADVDMACLALLDVRVPGSPALTRNQRCP